MSDKKSNGEKWSIDTTKEMIESKKKEGKGKKDRGITFRPYIEDLRTRMAMVDGKKGKNS